MKPGQNAATNPSGEGQPELLSGAALARALDGAPDGVTLPTGMLAQRASDAVFQSIDTGKLEATFCILTTEKNRQGNSHQITAGKLGQGLRTDLGYEQAPVVLFDHGMSGNPYPVATSTKVKKTAKQAIATAVFPERLRDFYPANLANADLLMQNSAAVFAGVAEGLLRMSSIGFRARLAMLREMEAEQNLPQGVERMDCWRGLHFVETEMHEWSITAIGADRGALKQTLERGKIHDAKLPTFLRQSFDAIVQAEPDPVRVQAGVAFDANGLVLRAIGDLTKQVQRLARRMPKREKTAAAATAGAPAANQNLNQTAADPANAVASHPRSERIGGVLIDPVAVQRLAEALKPTPPAAQPQLQSLLADHVGKVVGESVGQMARNVEAVRRELDRQLGGVATAADQ